MNALIELRDVTREYGHPPTRALDGVSLCVDAGEVLAIVGPSGSGKSTLLNVMGTLDQVIVAESDVVALSDDELSALRARRIGFVFQQFHLTEGTPVIDAVAEGLLYIGAPRAELRRRAKEALERVGLSARSSHRPHQLSGGERQRVAIARAVIGNPALLLADEPTGSLDSVNGASVLELLLELNCGGTTVVVITHDSQLAALLPRQVTIKDGRLLAETGAVSGVAS